MIQWFIAVLVALAVGGVIKSALRYFETEAQISLVEFVVAGVVVALIVVPVVNHVGNKIARGNLVRYYEFWSGYEKQTTHEQTPCHRDGSCSHTYQCDAYTVVVTTTVADADGEGTHTETHTETRYHDCPVATVENKFVVETTLGDYTIADGWFDSDPVAWRGSHGISGDVGRGIPPFWQAAKDRIDAHDPGPVTKVMRYDNYILASSHTILNKFSDEVDAYDRKHLLPPPVVAKKVSDPIRDFYYADKMSFVNVKADKADKADKAEWNQALARFNAALGSDLQGDLHIVAVDASVDPDKYTGAVNAWWQSKEFGKYPLSKNGIGVVMGVDAKCNCVGWARAFTGMPIGNAGLVQDVRNLKGFKFDPDIIIGGPIGKLKGDKVSIDHGVGALEKIFWGEHKFHRICMTCKEESGAGFKYLNGEIQPTSGQRWAIFIVAVVLSTIVWLITLLTVVGEVVKRPTRYVTGRISAGW